MTNYDTLFMARNGFIPPELSSQSKLASEVAAAFEYAPHAIQCAVKFQTLQSTDETRTEGQKRARVAEYARQVTADAIGTMNKQLRRAADRVAYLTEKVESVYEAKDVAYETRLNGIADNLAKMERVERDARIRNAIQNGEQDLLRAIVTRPQNSRICSNFQYAEARKAFEQAAIGEAEIAEMNDLRDVSSQLKTARDNLQDVMRSEFISRGDYVNEHATVANEMFQRAMAVDEVMEE